ncbi:MAG: hypothetical protein HY286_05700 [Planctomycetes bacterium]|nr:hypothetical protein [Planctomycetota bacterium]
MKQVFHLDRALAIYIFIILIICASCRTSASENKGNVPAAQSKPADTKELFEWELSKLMQELDDLTAREAQIDRLTDPEKRLSGYETLTDACAEIREKIGDLVEDPRFRGLIDTQTHSRDNDNLGKQLKVWATKMNVLVVKSKRAAAEVQSRKSKSENK